MRQLEIPSQPKKHSRELLSVFQPAGNTDCVNWDSELSAEQKNCLRVSKHTQQGLALSLQGIAECKSHHMPCPGACLLRGRCMCLIKGTQAKLQQSLLLWQGGTFCAPLKAGFSCVFHSLARTVMFLQLGTARG